MQYGAALLISLLLATSAAEAAEPVTVGVAEIGYQDILGAPDSKQRANERTRKCAEALRQDLGADGKFKVVTLECGKDPCSITRQTPEDLIAAAKKAGARVLVYGGVHKVSPALQNMRAQAVDIEAAKLVFNQAITISGDDAASWKKAERFLAEELLKAPLAAPMGQ
jgi:hypothetical protein